MLVVIVNGKGSSGKTSFELMVQKIAAARDKKVEILSTIDYIKEKAVVFGWDGGKTPKDRRFLSDLKDALTRWDDIPYKKIQEKIEVCRGNQVDCVFVDCREPEEIQKFVNDYQALTLLVQRGGGAIVYGNHADDNVMNYEYDVIIDNSRGLDELMQEAAIFEETFIEEGED